jgi:CubicO group peptidase (beta-lactamase class C family)
MPRRSSLILAFAALAPVLGAQNPRFASLDSAVWTELRAARIPGAALVIVRGDQVVHVRGFGVADGRGRPVTAETPFYLGPTTKSFTAFAVLQLVHDGRVDLVAPVRRFLPWFSLADSAVSRALTVRQLLLHGSGISSRVGERVLHECDTSAAAAERHIRWLAGERPVDGFAYSNLHYTTLGLVAEAASGVPFATYLQTRVRSVASRTSARAARPPSSRAPRPPSG